MTRRILLTGASGFVGTHLRAVLMRDRPGDAVTCTTAGGSDAGSGLVPLDIIDRKAVGALIAELKPDIVIHLAAQASVVRSNAKDDDTTWSTNVGGTINLAESIARHAPDATVLFTSSAEVYGGSFLTGPVAESATLLPLSPYAKSKATAERVLADLLPPSSKLIVARPFNHTGPGQREDFVLPSFAAQIARIETGLQPPCMAVGNLDVRRDFLHVRDVVEAYMGLVGVAATLPPRFTVNVASGRLYSLRELLERLRGLATTSFEIRVDPSRVRRVDLPSVSGCPALLRSVTGWVPKVDIEETLAGLLSSARQRL